MCSRLLAGSEALVNTLKLAADAQNISFFDAAKSAGYNLSPDDLSKMVLAEGSYAAFVELHIEQGPLLEEEGKYFIPAPRKPKYIIYSLVRHLKSQRYYHAHRLKISFYLLCKTFKQNETISKTIILCREHLICAP